MKLSKILHIKKPFLIHTWFILLVFFFWPLSNFFCIIAFLLLLIQAFQLKKIKTKNSLIVNLESYEKTKKADLDIRETLILEKELDLKEKETLMFDNTKKFVLDKMLDERRSHDQYCELTKIKTHQECEKIKQDCILLEHNTKEKCRLLEIKSKRECNKLEETTINKCEEIRKNIDKQYEDVQQKWSKISMFSDTHYKEIQQMTDEMLQTVDSMSNGHDFERFFAILLENSNYEEVAVTKGSGDMGADIIAVKYGIRYAFQCKRYTNKVDTKAVQEIIAGLSFYACHIGIVITNSAYTNGAKDLAKSKPVPIVLWDRSNLKNMINEYCKKTYISKF